MAKEKRNQTSGKAEKKPDSSSQGFTSGPFFRNFSIILVLSIIFIGIYKLNEDYAEVHDLYSELDFLSQRPGNHAERMDEIQHRLHDIQSDTGYIKTLFFGYFYDVHNVAFGVQNQIDQAETEIKEEKAKFGEDNTGPITREDKLTNKVHTFRLVNFINANCPPNSVVLLPPADSLSNNPKWNYVYDPGWVEYFIYPRLCIASGKESESPELAKRITHILIIKGIGYDKLKYDVPLEKREKVCLLPINKPMDEPQPTDTAQTSH